MTQLNDTDLHPGTLAIVEALLDSSLEDRRPPPVNEDALARYACGWITPEERDSVVAALTASADMRARLIQMTESLRSAGQGVDDRNSVFESDSALKRVMVSALKSTSRVLANWEDACTQGPNHPELRVEEKRSLRSLFLGMGKRVEPLRLSPSFSATRGAQTAKVVVEPGNVFADLAIRVEEDDSLFAKAKFSQPFAEPREISLYIVEPGGAWAWIGSNLARGSDWTLATPEYASMLGLVPGEAASHCFALSEGRWFSPRGWVALYISDQLRGKKITSPTRLRLRTAPAVRNGNFILGFEFPDSLREVFAQDRLTLSIDFGGATLMLGEWNVRELPPSLDVELSAPSLGVPDGEFEMHAAMNLMLRPAK